jgi:hypothetical protein
VLRAALGQLRLKLLDLTGRNRLLNFKHTPGRSLQSVEGHPQSIYARLVEGTGRTSIAIEGVPEPRRSDWAVRDGRYVRPDAAEWAAVHRIPTSYNLASGGEGEAAFRALLYPDDLAKHCRKLEREANLAIEETGANMLFLVLGFLEYPDQPQSDRRFLAPLVSIPVELSSQGRDGQKIFEINYTGDDVVANLSLREKLRVDHSLNLPEFDEDQGDVEGYFAAIAGVIRTRPGFEVRRRVSLCLLSFTNMLLVRDLDPENWPSTDKAHALLDHVVVRQLFEGQQDQGGSGLIDPPMHVIDDGPASKIPLIFDADSSQHSALVDVLHEKRHLVIEGPPGTGKSQTITNLIAACIAEGKTVLFVAEKLAALEVVKSRLSMAGLDPFVLELHSSKTSKKRVLEEIGKRIAHRPTASIDLPRRTEQLAEYRQQLRSYVNLLKSVTHNAMGLSVHTLIWRTERYRLKLSSDDVIRTPPDIKDAPELTPLAFSRRIDSLQHLATQHIAIGGFDAKSTFWGFYPERLLPGDEQTLKLVFSEAATWTECLVADADAYCALQDGGTVGMSVDTGPAQLQSLAELRASAPKDAPLHLVPRMFAADSTGARVKQLVERVGARLARYSELAPTVRAGLKNEADGTQEQLNALTHIDGMFKSLGCALGATDDLAATQGKLRAAADPHQKCAERN